MINLAVRLCFSMTSWFYNRAQKRAEIYALNTVLGRAETVSSGGLILVVGGSNFHKQANTISAFHPASGMWRDFGRTLQPRCNAAACVLPAGINDMGGNTVVCAGGYLPGAYMLDQHSLTPESTAALTFNAMKSTINFFAIHVVRRTL